MALSDYQTAGVDFLTLITAWREVLQIELQVAQYETELGKSLASLERAVGVQLGIHPPSATGEPMPEEAPPPSEASGPFNLNEPEADLPPGPPVRHTAE